MGLCVLSPIVFLAAGCTPEVVEILNVKVKVDPRRDLSVKVEVAVDR